MSPRTLSVSRRRWGCKVKDASIGDEYGVVNVPADYGQLFEHLVAVLAGPAIEGSPIAWPPRQKSENGDEVAAWVLTEFLILSKADWDRANELCADIFRQKQVRNAMRRISVVLLEQGWIDGDEIRRLSAEAWLPPQA